MNIMFAFSGYNETVLIKLFKLHSLVRDVDHLERLFILCDRRAKSMFNVSNEAKYFTRAYHVLVTDVRKCDAVKLMNLYSYSSIVNVCDKDLEGRKGEKMNCNCVCKTDMHTTTVSGFAESNDVLIQHDATWIISSTFIIFTMQSGKRKNT